MCTVVVSMLPLVFTCIDAEVRGRPFVGDCTLSHPRNGGGVVHPCSNGSALGVMSMGNEAYLGQSGRMLQVAVGDCPFRVVSGYPTFLYRFGHGEPP